MGNALNVKILLLMERLHQVATILRLFAIRAGIRRAMEVVK